MKHKRLFFIILIILGFGVFFSKFYIQEIKKDEVNRNKNKKNNKFSPSDWLDNQRTYPYGTLNQKEYLKAMKSAVAFSKNNSRENINWEQVGPTNIGGRISDIEIHPNTTNTIYVGGASGGVLKSTDNGANWANVFADQPTIGIGDIAIDPNNESIVYVGTGESNASSNTFLGSGIYKSTNGGQNWANIGLENTAYIGRVIVDYNNSNKIFVAACGNLFTKNGNRGIYRTLNGGVSWEKVLFINDSTSGIDIVQHPTNPDILYAAMWERFRGKTYRRSFGESSGIWKTTDGGDNWTELTTGLPAENEKGRIGIDISKTNPNVLYAFYDMQDGARVYKTTDNGNTWTRTSDSNLSDMSSSYGWYFGQIRIDPQDENRVFVMGLNFYRTENGGATWTESSDFMHPDHHAMIFSGNKIWDGNDGGLYYSTNNGTNWTKNNNIPFTQFYDIALDSTNVNRLYGGTQDNNSIRTATGNVDDWEVILGGDGMYCLVDYTNPQTFYCEYQNGGIYRMENDGNISYYIGVNDSRTNWATPYILHPTNPNILYVGTYRVHKSTNKGNSWTLISNDLTKGGSSSYHTITTIDISKINPEIIITGSADGKVYITTNDGSSWTDITSGLPDRWITRVKTDPFDANTIYCTVSGFTFDEAFSHVFKSEDLGQNWTAIDGNLPEIPVNVILIDPEIHDRYYVGTDAGAYMTSNGGETWESITQTLPNVPIFAMELHHATRMLFLGTYGIGAYKANFPIQNVSVEDIHDEKLTLFPNPVTSDNINVKFISDKQQSITISISDIKGRIVYSQKNNVNNGENHIKIFAPNKLTKGIYFCRIKAEGKIFIKKIIIA